MSRLLKQRGEHLPNAGERRPIREGARRKKIRALAARIGEYERTVDGLRRDLDAELYDAAHDGLQVKSLAEAAMLSRESTYKAIRRHQDLRRPKLDGI